MNILQQIVEHKKLEVVQHRMSAPMQQLQSSAYFYRPCLSLRQSLLREGSTGIIAEFKRRSPSKGEINGQADVAAVTAAYAAQGAAGLSVLTDRHFFGGSNSDLLAARANNLPILRKDFIIDEYQIAEAKSIGADVILLIAACLTPEDVQRLATFAKHIGLEVLLEIHQHEEVGHICAECDLVGVNNRDLRTFVVDVNRSIELAPAIPRDKVTVSESGISAADTIATLKAHGYSGFLIGETFMKDPDPTIAFASFIKKLKSVSERD